MTTISDKMVEVTINFLFPKLEPDSKAYEAIHKFIDDEFEQLNTVVLYHRNQSFVKLLNEFGLDIAKKEVIITTNAVRVTNNFICVPHIVYSR